MNPASPNPIERAIKRGYLPVVVVDAAPTDTPPLTNAIAVFRARISGATILLYGYPPTPGWVSVTLS